ncbi:hypothetical protein R6Q59_007760 [Mikania micrantha]
MKQVQVFCILILILITISSTEAIDYAKNGCNDTCGFIRIPYPFGIGASCSANKWYVVDCNSSTPYLSAFNNMEVLDVNLEEQTVIVNVSVISSCHYSTRSNNSSSSSSNRYIPSIDLGDSPYVFSGKHNILTFEGCGYASLLANGEVLSMCSSTTCTNYTSDERNVCQTKVPYNLKSYSVEVSGFKGLGGGDGACRSGFLGITPLVFDTIWRHGDLKIQNASYYPIALMWFLTKDEVFGKQNCWEPKRPDLGKNGWSIDHLRKCSCGMWRAGNPYLYNQCEDAIEALSLAKKGCQERCGEVGIPFPFGIGDHCALDERYAVDCNSSIPYLSAFNNMQVLNISLEQQTITVNVSMIFDCQNRIFNSSQIIGIPDSPFLFSRLHNIFVVTGCGNAVITDIEGTTVTGCSTTCSNDTFMDLNNCYGIGCCQATVPYYLQQFTLNLTRLAKQDQDGTCGSAFLVDKDSFLNGNFSLQPISKDHYIVPISLFWPLTLLYERDVPTFERPECTDLGFYMHDGSLVGYRKCQCNMSQEGNPYLPKGCRKSEECRACERSGGVCSRLFSSVYDDATSQIISKPSCDMPYRRKSSIGVILGVSISMGLLFITAFIYTLYKIIKKTIEKRRKEKFLNAMVVYFLNNKKQLILVRLIKPYFSPPKSWRWPLTIIMRTEFLAEEVKGRCIKVCWQMEGL